MKEQVVLVTPNDEVLGLMDKQEAHIQGVLHRAFSVFLFNEKGDMLLQKRASSKYHSPDKWTNACCSHPRENESYYQAAQRRLREELGIETEISEQFHFIYKAFVGQGLWEHELDYVFVGQYDGNFNLNEAEVSEVRYLSIVELEQELTKNPEHFTEWFKIILKKYKKHLKNIINEQNSII